MLREWAGEYSLTRTYCGLTSPPPGNVITKFNNLEVTFRSDTIFQYSGFNATFTSGEFKSDT